MNDGITISLMPYKRQRITVDGNIRSMEEADVADVVDLLSEMYRDYDFFSPFESKDFAEYLGRISHFGFHDVLVLENNDKFEAC